jgi:pimeloyl-ACP methyl ester carboxylesterase
VKIVSDQYLTLKGCKIRFRDTGGAGPVVLLTHGIGASLETWEVMLAEVDERIRWIGWDVPGHGLSDFDANNSDLPTFAELGWQLLDALSVQRAVLAGNSMGGAISVLMAGSQPERTDKLGLLNSAAMGKHSPMPFRLMTIPILGEILSKPGKMAIKQQIDAIFYHSDAISERTREIITRNVMHPGASKAFLTILRSMTNLSGQNSALVAQVLGILSSTQIPILFIHGRYDKVLPLVHSEHAHQHSANSSLLILEECGHTPQLEQPQTVAKALVEFVLLD